MFLRHAWLDRASGSPIGVGDDNCVVQRMMRWWLSGMTREVLIRFSIGVGNDNCVVGDDGRAG